MYQQESITCCICSVKTPDELHLERHILEDHADIFQTEQDDASPVNATCENGFDVKCDVGFNVFAYDVTHDASNNVSHDVTNYVTQHNDVTTDTFNSVVKEEYQNVGGFETPGAPDAILSQEKKKVTKTVMKEPKQNDKMVVPIDGDNALKNLRKKAQIVTESKYLESPKSVECNNDSLFKTETVFGKKTYLNKKRRKGATSAQKRKSIDDPESQMPEVTPRSELKSPAKDCLVKTESVSEDQVLEMEEQNANHDARCVEKTQMTISEPFQCKICFVKLSTKSSCSCHMKIKHQGQSVRNRCIVCKIDFRNGFELARHQKTVEHLSKMAEAAQRLIVAINQAPAARAKSLPTECDKPKQKEFVCAICNKVLKTKWSYDQHQQQIHRGQKRTYNCRFCQMNFPNGYALHRHQLTEGHVSKRPIFDSSEFKNGFRCNICDARFKNKKTLTAHQKNIHVQDQTECELCKKVFANRDYYSSHKRLVHEGRIKKKYVKLKTNCEICNIVVNECNYDKHRKKHLESKIRAANIEFVPCDVCGKVVRKSNYDRHIRHIHKTVKMVRSRKLVECKICHITVLVKSLRRHEMEVHDGIKRTFTCAQCRIDFETDNLLQKHMRAHKNKENLIMSEN